MRFISIFPLVFTLLALCPEVVRAQAQTKADTFQAGVAAFQKNDLNTARTSFTDVLTQDPNDADALFNLGLVESKAGKPGRALALWRKALVVHPGFAFASHAIDYTRPKLEHPEIPHEVEFSETLRSDLFVPISLSKYLLLDALLLLSAGWLLIRFAGERRRALAEEKPLPGFPAIGVVLAVVFFAISALSVDKAMDASEVRGTIIEKKIEVRSTPDANGTALFDLYEGLEVVVRSSQGDWVQVSYPGGATGWIPKSALFTTRDQVTS
jgi:tetratricopeptide (TPR) repeat protein